MNKASIAPLVASALLLFLPLSARALTARAEFNPSILIEDRRFCDTATMGGAEGIQRFLESKGSVLANTAPDFLAMLGEPTDSLLKLALGDPGWDLGRPRSAAELIWDAAQASGLNPQVILVTLNKEQGLITNARCTEPSALQRMLKHAMGFDCPDGSGCGNLFPGFYYQLFGNLDTQGNRYLGAAKSLMRSFNTSGGRGPALGGVPAKVGQTVTLDNTLGGYDGIAARQAVTIGNLATAALYRYTPHVFNGNYNFWKFFTSWFKYPNGTLISSTADGAAYVIEDGMRKRVPSFVAAARRLDLDGAARVSLTELTDYPLGPAYVPPDDTVIAVGDALFAFSGGIMHPATSFVLSQRKIDSANKIAVSASDAALFTTGPQLTPADGTVLRGVTNPDVFLVENGLLKKFSPFVFRQRDVERQMQVIPDAEIALYPKQGYVAPLSGTLIRARSGGGTYVMAGGQRRPLTDELFKNLAYNRKDVVTLETDAEMASIPLGAPSTPREGTYFSIGASSELFVFKNGAKHPIYPFVAKQRGITPDYSFEAGIVSGWPDGIAIAPRDGTLMKSNAAPAVYTVVKGQLRELTMDLARNLGLKTKNAVALPDYMVAAFAKNGYAEPAEGTYFKVAETGEFYVFRKGAKRRIYPFVAAQRHMTPDFTFPAAVAGGWAEETPIAPRDGTLLKSDAAPDVYLVAQAKLRPLAAAAFKRLGYSSKNVKTLTAAEIAAFPKGDLIAK